jgi:hypothetical protein
MNPMKSSSPSDEFRMHFRVWRKQVDEIGYSAARISLSIIVRSIDASSKAALTTQKIQDTGFEILVWFDFAWILTWSVVADLRYRIRSATSPHL